MGKILKVNSSKPKNKLVGVLLPPQDDIYLALFCGTKRITKTKVFRTLLDDWFCKQRKKRPELELIKEIAGRIEADFKNEKSKIGFDFHKQAIEKELLKKFTPELVKEIFKYVKP